MEDFIEYFISYITIEKGAAPSTIHKYRADLKRCQNFLKTNQNISDFALVRAKNVRNYLSHLKSSYDYQTSSIANKVNILKHFFSFLHKSGYIKEDPTCLIKTPPKRRKLPKVLNDIEVEKLLKMPEYNTGPSRKFIIRDKLILTMFIYTGLRKSELLKLNGMISTSTPVPCLCVTARISRAGLYPFTPG